MMLRRCVIAAAWIHADAASFALSDVTCVVHTGGDGLNVHTTPALAAPVNCSALPSDAFRVKGGPVVADNYTWWWLENKACSGWAVATFLAACGGNATRWNRFGLGLVSPGDSSMNSYVSNLAGQGGWILLVFPGVTNVTAAPPSDWVAGVAAAYASGLRPVVRIGPPWGDTFYRDMADDAAQGEQQAWCFARRVYEGSALPPT